MTIQEANQEDETRGRYAYLVNSVPHRTRDRKIDAREILTTANYIPADQHVLIQILHRAAKSLGLDEKVDLRDDDDVEQFRAFEGDRIYTWTVEARGYEWGAAMISETELRGYEALRNDQIFALDRTHAPDLLIADDSDIRLDGRGSERLKIVPRPLVAVTVNTKKVELGFGWHTGADIKAKAIAQGVAIQPDFTLDEEVPGGETKVIGDNDRTFVSGGEVFGAVDNHEDS
jgi:hypothetical protein